MQQIGNQAIIIFFSALAILLLYLLAPIFTPFLLGALLAYLSHPLVKRLERRRIPHLVSVTLVFMFLIFIFLVIILMLTPLIQKQIETLIEVTPQIIAWTQDTAVPTLQRFITISSLKT